MQDIARFKLKFITHEQHLLLPNITSIILVQNLYNMLFQYVISSDKEEKLKSFIEKLEKHIKSKPKAPFSMPLADLDFLGEGLQELKLLNWMESPVTVFEIEIIDECADYEEELEKIYNLLEDLITFNRKDTNTIYVYSSYLTRY